MKEWNCSLLPLGRVVGKRVNEYYKSRPPGLLLFIERGASIGVCHRPSFGYFCLSRDLSRPSIPWQLPHRSIGIIRGLISSCTFGEERWLCWVCTRYVHSSMYHWNQRHLSFSAPWLLPCCYGSSLSGELVSLTRIPIFLKLSRISLSAWLGD